MSKDVGYGHGAGSSEIPEKWKGTATSADRGTGGRGERKRGGSKGEVGTFMSRASRRRLHDSVKKAKPTNLTERDLTICAFLGKYICSGVPSS